MNAVSHKKEKEKRRQIVSHRLHFQFLAFPQATFVEMKRKAG